MGRTGKTYFCMTFTLKQKIWLLNFYISLFQTGLLKLAEIIKVTNSDICKYVKHFAKTFMGHLIIQISYIGPNMSAGILILIILTL